MILDDRLQELEAERKLNKVRPCHLRQRSPFQQRRYKIHTLNPDSDIHSTRNAQAAERGLIVGTVTDARLFVSEKTKNQGSIGGDSVCIVYRCGEL